MTRTRTTLACLSLLLLALVQSLLVHQLPALYGLEKHPKDARVYWQEQQTQADTTLTQLKQQHKFLENASRDNPFLPNGTSATESLGGIDAHLLSQALHQRARLQEMGKSFIRLAGIPLEEAHLDELSAFHSQYQPRRGEEILPVQRRLLKELEQRAVLVKQRQQAIQLATAAQDCLRQGEWEKALRASDEYHRFVNSTDPQVQAATQETGREMEELAQRARFAKAEDELRAAYHAAQAAFEKKAWKTVKQLAEASEDLTFDLAGTRSTNAQKLVEDFTQLASRARLWHELEAAPEQRAVTERHDWLARLLAQYSDVGGDREAALLQQLRREHQRLAGQLALSRFLENESLGLQDWLVQIHALHQTHPVLDRACAQITRRKLASLTLFHSPPAADIWPRQAATDLTGHVLLGAFEAISDVPRRYNYFDSPEALGEQRYLPLSEMQLKVLPRDSIRLSALKRWILASASLQTQLDSQPLWKNLHELAQQITAELATANEGYPQHDPSTFFRTASKEIQVVLSNWNLIAVLLHVD